MRCASFFAVRVRAIFSKGRGKPRPYSREIMLAEIHERMLIAQRHYRVNRAEQNQC